MSANIEEIAKLLEASLDHRQAKHAEHELRRAETQPGFSIALLQIVASTTYTANTRFASAIFFKNFVIRNWTDEDGNHKLPASEVTSIKSELINLMISVPQKLQAQLGEAISKIADSDFWQRWDTLVQDLASKLSSSDPTVVNGILEVAHTIFKRWRPLYRSDELFTEINHVLQNFSQPFLALLQDVDRRIEQASNDKVALQQHVSTMALIMQLFSDLSCQDLPPAFEDHLDAISQLLLKYLTYDNPLLHTDDDSDSVERLKVAIFEVLTLYVQKYLDAFAKHLEPFMGTSWQLLTTIGQEQRYDLLVSKALNFLTVVVKNKDYAQNFNNEQTLGQVVEKVILPNVEIRESDLETFEDEPVAYIKRDLEGSDSDSRRRAATDLVRELLPHFEKLVTGVVLRYVEHFLKVYSDSPATNRKAKDTAVYLFSAVAAKGVPTFARGLAETNPEVNVLDFFQRYIATDLTGAGADALLKVDAIKFLYTFRNQLSKQDWQAAYALLAEALDSSNPAVYTYAAIAIERVLYMVDDKHQPYIMRDAEHIRAEPILKRLLQLMTKDARPEKVQENEYVAKCVMRILIVLRGGVASVLDLVLQGLVNITRVIRHNPSNPLFYYYHFESYGALIRFAAAQNAQRIEQTAVPTFAEILQSEVAEFQPYVLQLFALLLETAPAGTASAQYAAILPITLNLEMYNTKTIVPALVRVLNAIIPRAAEQIATNNQTETIFVIFQKLIATKANESHAFDLIETVIDSFPVTALQPYFTTMLQLMLTRLSNSKTENFALRFVRFYHFFASRDGRGLGTDQFVSIADQVQQNIFTQVYLTVILPDTQKLTRPYDRKIAVVSLSHTLATSQAFVERYGKKGWGLTCEALLKLLINPPEAPKTDDAIAERDTEDIAFNVGFTALNTCRPAPRDPFPEVQDVRAWLSTFLKEQDAATSGRISGFVQQRLSSDAQAALQSIMS